MSVNGMAVQNEVMRSRKDRKDGEGKGEKDRILVAKKPVSLGWMAIWVRNIQKLLHLLMIRDIIIY